MNYLAAWMLAMIMGLILLAVLYLLDGAAPKQREIEALQTAVAQQEVTK